MFCESSSKSSSKPVCKMCSSNLNIKNIVRPCKSSDSHIFCKDCYEKHKNNSLTKETHCPDCGEVVDFSQGPTVLSTENAVATVMIMAAHYGLIE